MSNIVQLSSQETLPAIVKEECDLEYETLQTEYETLQTVRELQAIREEEHSNDLMEEIFGVQSRSCDRSNSEGYNHSNTDEGATLVIIKEEIDCDSLENIGFELDSVYTNGEDLSSLQEFSLPVNSENLNNKNIECTAVKNEPNGHPEPDESADILLPATTLRRSSRKRCQRFSSLADLEDEPEETPSKRVRSFAVKSKLWKSCSTASSLSFPAAHEDVDYLAAKGMHVCNVCRRSFISLPTLKRHQRIHSNERLYSCECGANFKQPDHLRKHEMMHTTKEIFVCDTCGKVCNKKSSLIQHMDAHTRVHPYICDTCGKSFATRESLIPHTRTHMEQRPFRCDFCGRAFKQGAHLRVHLRIHTGDRPYDCGDCGRSFYRPTHLRKHSKVHRRKVKTER